MPVSTLTDELRKADAQLQRGNLRNAENSVRKFLKKYPKNPKGICILGLVRFHQGRSEESIRLMESAIEQEPDDPRIRYEYANILKGLNRVQDAIQEYRNALSPAGHLRLRISSDKQLHRFRY